MAVFGALVGLGILILTIFYGNKFKKKILQYLAAIVGFVVGVSAAGIIAGDDASKAGEYMVYIGVPVIIIKQLFFKQKKL